MNVPTPIPESAVGNIRSFFGGGTLDVIWKALVIGFILVSVYVLAAAGIVGGIVAGIVLGALLSDDVRAILSDLWHRDFWIWRT